MLAFSLALGHPVTRDDKTSLSPREENAGQILFKGCPSASPPKGVLYNHISKTGGTTMKNLLMEATGGRVDLKRNMTQIKINGHVKPNSPELGVDGSLIIQEDVFWDLKVNKEDAHNFFVIGLVRRPCDYLLSSWAWGSGIHASKAAVDDGEIWGLSPPYKSTADRERFERWLTKTADARDAGAGWGPQDNSFFMSSALAARYDDTNLVHCWVRTHEMTDDLRVCFQKYEECGGKWDREGLEGERAESARTLASQSIVPTPHPPCNDMFSNASLYHRVLESERPLIQQYAMKTCCS